MPESATEWTPSASIEDEPLKANATNLAAAMARLAPSAAMIALVPPDALMVLGCPFVGPAVRGACTGAADGHSCSPAGPGGSGGHGGPEDGAVPGSSACSPAGT